MKEDSEGRIMDNEQISLFENEESDTLNSESMGNLNVVRLDFIEGITATWKDLFEGFDELHAITYSSGIGFIAKLINLFDNAEIIFGCEQVMSYSLNEIMAFQTELLSRIRSDKSKNGAEIPN